MDVEHGIDELILSATIFARSKNEQDAERLERDRTGVLASIKAWCDCGKGDACPQYVVLKRN